MSAMAELRGDSQSSSTLPAPRLSLAGHRGRAFSLQRYGLESPITPATFEGEGVGGTSAAYRSSCRKLPRRGKTVILHAGKSRAVRFLGTVCRD